MMISINNLVGTIGSMIIKNCTYSMSLLILYIICQA